LGRYDFSSRELVEDCERICIFYLIRELKKEIKRNKPGYTKAEVSKTLKDIITKGAIKVVKGEKVSQFLDITSTQTNLGIGVRYWFICDSCRNRVAVLYSPHQRDKFLCRRCHNLTYKSQKEHDSRVDNLLKSPALLSDYRHLNLLKPTEQLVFIKAMMKLDDIKAKKVLKKHHKKRRNDIDISIDLGSFRKK